MPSSTSSFDEAPYTRPLPATARRRTFAVALLSFLGLMAAWELHWRDFGATPSYRNSEGLWAIQRRRIDAGEGDATVVVGSSRILFDFQLDVWERLSGSRPIQLALEGTSPVSFMEDLAADPDFTGTLLVGVSPGLFFSGFEYRSEMLKHYRDGTPSEWIGQRLSMLIEPYLAYYHFDFALPAILRRQEFPNRAGVAVRMEVRRLTVIERDRNTRLWSKLEDDEEYARLAKRIWADGWMPLAERPEPARAAFLERRAQQIDRAVAAYETLTARGVEVIFIMPPFEGHYAASEPDIAPRAETWDLLIERTGALGLHFEDHPEMQGYRLAEWSHMIPTEADRFTAALHALIERERQRPAGS